MSAKSQKRPRESSGTASASGAESIHRKREGIAIDQENGAEGNLMPPSKRVRHNGLARNEAEVSDMAVDMEPENDRDIATGPSKSGTAPASGSQPATKRSRKAKGDAASTAGASAATAPPTTTARAPAPTGATSAPTPPSTRPTSAKDYNHMSQRYPSAPSVATVVSASSVSAGGIPKGVRKGVGSLGTKRPPLAPSANGEGGQHSMVAVDMGTGAGASAGSGSSLPNRSKAKGKARASKAQGVADAGAPTTGQTLSMSAIGGAAGAESPARGVSPSRFRRIAGSTDDFPNDFGRGSGKSGLRSSTAEEKNGEKSGIAGHQEQAGASAGTDWADRFLCKVLPALGDCSAIEVAKNVALKGMLLLAMVLGSWIIWTSATFTASRVLKGSVEYNGGEVQEGISRRAIALSLVHETEEHQSLKEVLESRQRQLEDMRARDEALSVNLETLRKGANALDRNMQVLREQAKSAAASRGLPHHPEAMEEITRSQLAEVEGMLWTLKEARDATRRSPVGPVTMGRGGPPGVFSLGKAQNENIAAGQKWGEDAERDLEKDNWQLQRAKEAGEEASTAWETEVEPLLTSAYLEVEEVAAAADVLREHIMRKPSTEDVDGYVQTVEENYKAATTARRRSEVPDLKQRVETIVAREVEMKWSISGEEDFKKGDDASEALESPLLRTVDEMKQLVAREIEIFASGGTGLRDYASLAGGASVVHGDGLTSPSMISMDHGWWGYTAKLFGMGKDLSRRTADEALSTSNAPGHCFAFRGGRGKLTVKLVEPRSSVFPEGGHLAGFVRVTHISIEHAAVAAVPSVARSAPRVFLVLGWDADPTASSTSLRPHVLVNRAEFSVKREAPAVQTFEVFSDGGRSSPPPVGWVTLEIESNHGGAWTCLYGFRVHGESLPSQGLSKAL